MPYNGSGSFSPPGADFPAVAGTLIESSKFNNVINDIGTGLSTAVTKDGQTTITANLPMAGFRHTGVGDATAGNQYAKVDEIQEIVYTVLSSVAGTDTITATLAPTIAGYVANHKFIFKAAGTNTGATTININSLGAKTVQSNGSALIAGQITSGRWYEVIYDGTNFQLLTISTPNVLPGNISLTGDLNSTKAAATNYTRITPNLCLHNTPGTLDVPTYSTATALPAPSATAKALIVRVLFEISSANAIGTRASRVDFSATNGGGNELGSINVATREEVAVAATNILKDTMDVFVPLPSAGTGIYYQAVRDNTDSAIRFRVIGYTD